MNARTAKIKKLAHSCTESTRYVHWDYEKMDETFIKLKWIGLQ